MTNAPRPAHGPFHIGQVHDGDGYELSQGHAVYCAPAGGRHGDANTTGALPLATDPAVTEAGIDVGYALSENTLRAPDVSVGYVPSAPGWVKTGVPPLAVEYADTGTDEADLQVKLAELLAAGVKWVWVVRLVGPRRVEVYTAGAPVRIASPGETLEAPGVLRNALAVEALWDRNASYDATLRNLLQRKGFDGLDAVLDQGRTEGRSEGRTDVLALQFARRLGRALTDADHATLRARVATLGPERLGEVVLDLSPAELQAWWADPAAR